MVYTVINIFQIAGTLVGFLTLLSIARKKASETQKVLLIACCCAFVSIWHIRLKSMPEPWKQW